ncbi:hypothetical protein [Uliginosibacterium gangwonense]|uniref:hypothetical protein n=1 Tax=Uliginosibacterium gangwonense TaxID=392736 RepID=UPI000366D572|nr:hypothetical protein [Uliginosibacterium gangwonense]
MKIIKMAAILATVSLIMGVAQAGEVCPITHSPVQSEDQALDLAIKVTKAFKLTTIPVEHCLHFYVDQSTDKAGGYVVTVRENHNQECGGDPDTEPRVFDLEIKPDGQVATDAFPITGDGTSMRRLHCWSSKR